MDRAKVVGGIRNGLIIFAIMAGMVWANTYYRGHSQYSAGEVAFNAGNYKEAITDYGTAIRMYTPMGGYVEGSVERLWQIGEGYEKAGQPDWALISYRELRSALYAVRSFYTPYQDWITRSEARIDQVLAAQRAKEQAPPATSGTP